MKTCSKCNTDKEKNEFYRDKNRKDGHYPECKICVKTRYYENIEYNKKYHREHYIKNYEEKKKKRNKYYAENKHLLKENRKNLKTKYNNAKASAKSRGLSFTISFEDYSNILSTGKCRYCAGDLPEYGYSLDRVNSNLGYDLKNVVACCSSCNEMKMDKSPEQFLAHIKKILENFNHTS